MPLIPEKNIYDLMEKFVTNQSFVILTHTPDEDIPQRCL